MACFHTGIVKKFFFILLFALILVAYHVLPVKAEQISASVSLSTSDVVNTTSSSDQAIGTASSQDCNDTNPADNSQSGAIENDGGNVGGISSTEGAGSDSDITTDTPSSEGTPGDSGITANTPSAEDTGSDSVITTDASSSEGTAGDNGITTNTPSAGDAGSDSDITTDTPSSQGTPGDNGITANTPSAGDAGSDSDITTDTPSSQGTPGDNGITTNTSSTGDTGSDTGTTNDALSSEGDGSSDNTVTGTSSSGDIQGNDGITFDDPSVGDTPSDDTTPSAAVGDDSSATNEGSLLSDGSETQESDQSLSQDSEPVPESESAKDLVTVSAGDPWGYILDAVTEKAVAGSNVEVLKILADGTTTNTEVINETNPVATDDSGKYSFTVKDTDSYQLKVTKNGYADFLSQVYDFTKDNVTQVENLYLVPLVTDAGGNDITIKHDLDTDGQDISINNASSIAFADDITVDTRSHDSSGQPSGTTGNLNFNSADSIIIGSNSVDPDASVTFLGGSVNLQAAGDVIVAENIDAPGSAITLKGKNLTVNDNIIVDTRQIDGAGITTGNSGTITMTGTESLTIGDGAKVLADVSGGSAYSPGTITLTAVNNVVHDFDLVNMNTPTTSANITVKGSIKGGDVVIGASTGLKEDPEVIDIDDYSPSDWAIAKLKEYIKMISLPVVVKMRDDLSTVTIDTGASITGNKVTIGAEANAQAKATGDFSKEFIGYCQAKAKAEVNINNGAVINATDDVWIKSNASTTADLDVTVDNSKNTKFSLVLGVTDTDLTSNVTVYQGACITTGKNVNVQALGSNYNHAAAKSTDSTDSKLMAMLSLNFTDSDVKADVNGSIAAGGEEITSQDDVDDQLTGGIGVLARLDSNDLARVDAGVGGTVDDEREKDIDEEKTTSVKDMIINYFQQNYTQKTEEAQTNKEDDSGANQSLQAAAACSCSKVDNDVTANIGSTAVLKSGLDFNVKSELVETPQTRTSSWIQGDNDGNDTTTSNAISAAVSIGLYANSATTNFAGQSDATRDTVISSSVSYPFLLQPFKDPTPGTFKNGLDLKDAAGQSLNFAKDVLGLMAEMINSWTASTASGETLGASGAVTYLEYTNNADTNVENTASINQNVSYQSDDQTVTINAATDLEQINVVGNFDFNLSSSDMDAIATQRYGDDYTNKKITISDDNQKLVEPDGAATGKAGIGGSILLSYINNTAAANVEDGAVIHAGKNGRIDVASSDKVVSMEFVQSGGEAEKFGVAGSFSLDNETANTSALINRGTVLNAGALNIKADDASSHINTVGGVMKGDGIGIGFSIGINQITRNVEAGIIEPDKSLQASTSNIIITGATNVEADAKGDILVLTVAASKPAGSGDAPDQSKDTSDTTSTAPESGSTGSDKSQGKYGIGVSGAVSINEVNDTVKAVVDYSDKLETGSLTVKATNETNILALTGSAAYTKSNQETSGTLAGAYSQVTLNGTTEASVIGTEMDTDALTLIAERLGNLWAISAGGANSTGQNGVAVAGSVSINTIRDNTDTLLDNMKGSVLGATSVSAKDKSSMHVIAGAEGYGGRGGFGAAVAYNDLQNNTKAQIINSNWTQTATLDLLAENSIRAGPIDESFDISGNPADNVEIFAIAASLGVSPKGNFGGAGTVAINRIRNTVEASMTGSTCDITGGGQVTFTSNDDSNIFSIAGAIGGAKNVGIGAAVAYNEIGNKAYSFIDSSTLYNPTALSLVTESGGTIKTLSLGAAGAQDAALGGSASVNTVNNDASAYIKNSTVSVINNISLSSTGNAGIGSVAGGFAGAGKAAVGAAIAINNIGSTTNPNKIKAYIESSQVITTSGSLSLASTSNSIIKSISAGGAGAEKCAIGGAVSVNNIINEIESYIKDCIGTEKGITAQNNVTLDAVDNSAVSVIAGSVDGAGTAAIAGSAATVSIGYYNPVDKTITYSKTKAYIENSRVTSNSGAVALTATSNSVIFNIAAGAGVAGTFGGQGSVCLNWIYEDLSALITNSAVTAQGDISAAAVTVKRTKMPKGATQTESDNTEITTFDGNTDDTDTGEADGKATTHSISSIQALAGSVAGGGTAGVGLVVATNKIANVISSGINGSTVTSNQGNIKLTAVSDASIEAVSAALAAAGEFAGAGSVSLNQINNQISSFIINSAVTSNNTGSALVNGQLPGVILTAGDTSTIRSISGGIGIGGSAGLGGAAAYNKITNTIEAYVEGCETIGGTDGYVNSSGSLTIKGESAATIETISAGGAFGGYAGVAGSVSINTIGNTVEAYIKDSAADIDDNIYILADSDNTIHGYGGALAGGLVGISGAVVVNTVGNTTRSYILHSALTASGTGGNVTVKNWDDNGDESTEDVKGLFVIADCSDVVEMYSGAAAGGAGAVAGQTSVNHINDTTEAFIGASNINSEADYGQWVKVKAHQGTQVDIWAGGLCVSAAGVGAAVDRTLVENTTRAIISDSDPNCTDPARDSNIYARGVEVMTYTREDVNPRLAGIAFSGTVSGAGAVSVVDFDGNNSVVIARSNVFAQGPINVYAADKALLDSKAATFAASEGGAIAGSVVVNTMSNTVQASVLGSSLNASGAITVKSLSNDKITVMTGGIGLGQGGIGGVVSFNTIESTTESTVGSSGDRTSLINQDARFKSGGSYAPDANQTVAIRAENTSTVDNTGLAGGAGIFIGGGAAVDVTAVQNRTVANVGAGSKIYSKGDINIEAQAAKTINSKTAAVGIGLAGISGAVSITTLGEAISTEGSGQFTAEFRGQVNSDTSVKNLKINSDDTAAKNAGEEINSLSAPSLDNILATTRDTSGKITAAYVEDGTAGGAKAEIVTDGDLNIKAINSYSINGTRGQVAGGLVAAGASVTIINTYDKTKAFIGSYSTIRANNLTVSADSVETAIAESYAAEAGLYAGGGNIAHVNIHPLVEVSIGSYSNISVLNQAAVTAALTPQAKASVYGVTVAVGAKAALADASAQSTPTVNASIGENAKVTCGYQTLEGDPVLTFFSGSQLTGSPVLTFTNESVQMSGNPALHFAPGAGGANDTVSRNDSGTWNGDGFKVGDYISISGTDKNNAVYQITGISGDGKTLTLDTNGTVQSEDKSGANVYIERAGEITRSSGSWYDDTFIEGEFILVSGTTANDGYYEVGKIINDNTLQVDVSDDIQNQITDSGNIIGDTADMIRRSTGSWLDDGFAAGQIIKVSGSADNDGQYTIKSISSDGKVLTLDSLNLFTKEQASGVNITIVDYENTTNNAGLKVNAGESLPASGSTAEAYAFGAGGALLSADCTQAEAKETSTVTALVANNADITVAGTVEISADTDTRQKAEADGYNGGAVEAGNNKAWASSNDSGGQLNITTAGLQDNVSVSALKLLISAYRTDDNYAEAFAGSGGAFDLVLIEAQTANDAATRASMGTGTALDVDRLEMIADHTATFNSKADSVSIAGIGVGAARANNEVNSTVEANIGSSSTILAREMTVYANNRTSKDWLSGSSYNVRSRSGGVLDFQAAESTTDITNSTNINVGDSTSILIPASVYNSGCLTMEILNSVLARDKASIDIGGAISGAKAVSHINNTNTGTVQIGRNVTITSAGDIDLSARTYSNIQTYALSKCYGAAGLADGDSRAVSTSANNVVIREGAKVTTYGELNLLAGQSSEGYPNTCYSLASADVNNWTAVCLKTSPQASGIINLNNYITIEPSASLRVVKDANLLTEDGITVTDGTGTAHNLYTDFLGMDCRNIDTAINVDSKATVNGSVEAGIQNQQLLTIEADGTVSTITEGVTYIKTKYEMHTQLLEELQLARTMKNEYAGTAAEEPFNDEITRLEGELIDLGHQVYDNGMIEESVWADYILVDAIWAQSSNINITAGSLTGSGTLQARGDAKIEIINKSPAYLRLNDLTIPENAGGKVVLNNSSLDSGLLNGVRIISGTSSGEPQITIENTYSGGNNPDVELYGNVENRNGSVYVSSTGGITSKGDIRAGSVTLSATGDFMQSYVDTFYMVGGEPRKIWQPVTSITESLKYLYNLYPHSADAAITQVLNTEPQSKIEAANIVISARYLNINGDIISGHPDQTLILGSDLNSKIASFWTSPHWDYHDNLIAENGGVKAYFDLITKRVIVEGVSAEGGYVSLFGQIMNTGKGTIEALDGYASIHIENHTNYDMVVGALDTGRGSEGMIVIKDTAPMTWTPDKVNKALVTVYTRIGDQIQVWDSVDSVGKTNPVAVYDSDADVAYQPLQGLRYAWVTAQSKLTETSITYRKSTWLGIDWLAKDPGNIYEQSTITLDAEPLLTGEYIEYRTDLIGVPYTYNYKSELVTQYDANGNPIVDKDGNPVPVLVYQDSWVKKKWWGKKTYYLQQIYEKATKDVNYHSIEADYPISIVFKGDSEGIVDITSDHGLIINGSIINTNGVTNVSAGGSVEQTEGTYIQSRDITVIGYGGIGNNAALSINLSGGSLTARALQGIIDIKELNGDLKLTEVTDSGGNVSLSAKGSITGATASSSVTGKLVSLTSESGGIGTVDSPLLINAGIGSGEGISAQAYNGIYFKRTEDGNINLIKALSDAGDVYIEAENGSIIDANTEFSRDTITEGYVLGVWNNLRLSGEKTAAELRYLIGVTLKTDRKPDIWLEDLNVKANNLTLRALNGSIGQITSDVTIDLTDLAALDRNSKLTLIAADPDDVQFYDAGHNLIAAGDNTTLAAYAVVAQPDEIDVQAGTIAAEAETDVFLHSDGETGINRVKGSQVRIRSDQGISNADDGSINIISDDLVLIAENGAIGTADKALALSIRDGSILRALARDGIYLDQQAYAGRCGELNLDYINTPGDVSLQAGSSILRANSGNNYDISCAGLNLIAGGTIGSSAGNLKLEQQAGSSLKAAAAAGVFLDELTGNMNIDTVNAGNGDVVLKADGSILAAANDSHTAVTGNNINLTASNGQTGEEARVLIIDSSSASPGLVGINAMGDVYIKEAAGPLNLGLVRSIGKGRVFIASAGAVTNGLGAAINVDAGVLKLDAVSGSGLPGTPINTTVNRIEGSGGTGGFYLDNQGSLIVGGVDSSNGIQADGNIQLTAHSPITIEEDLAAGGDINITAGASSGIDDLVLDPDRKVQAGGSITLIAGDNILINPNAILKAADKIDIQANGNINVTTAAVDGDGTVAFKGVNIPVTNNSSIKAGGAMSLDASGYLSILNSVLDSENSIDMTSATYVIIDQSTVEGMGNITIKANGGVLTVNDATIKSGSNISAQASADMIINRSGLNSGQCTGIQSGRDINLAKGIVNAGDSVAVKAADNILIDKDSTLAAVNNIIMSGDFGNADPGTGCRIEIYGTLAGQYMEASGESDNDEFIINGATLAGPLTILGGSGNDLYAVTALQSISTWHNGRKDRITMDGQNGSDVYVVNLAGAGDYIVETLDTGTVGTDVLTLNGTPDADKLLLRQKFIANLHGMEVERVNYDSNIENLNIYSFAGNDCFYIDDNSALTMIYGGEGDDSFQVGQMFGSARDANAGVAPGDEISTVLTTRGYLSRGISYETKIYGADGNDSFTVYSNQAHLVLEGEDGNDYFIIRAFALADPDNPNQPRTTVDGGNGDDYIEYNINSLVDIDGGAGNDTVRIIGSEFDDVFVISENGIVGAGLNVKSGDIECYEAYGMEGNDTFYIQATRAGMVTKVFGGYGSDSFYILGDVTKPVSTSGTYDSMVDHDLDRIKGTLIIEGGVSNEGADCVLLAGVTLPTETNQPLSDVPTVDESKMTDSLYVYNDDSAGGDTGTLTPGHLQGLGMGTGTTLNQGTVENPQYVNYPGGILFDNLEVVDILLGSGNDTFNIDSTSPGTITAVHGGGGKDKITAAGCGGPVVIYGDTDAQNQGYSGVKGTPSVNGHRFNNPDDDQIDADLYLNSAAIYGGPGDDYIIGTGLDDYLAGGPGSDRIDAGCGDDLVYGDSGFNVELGCRCLHVYNPRSYSSDSDFLDGGYGNDIIFGDYGAPCYISLGSSTPAAEQVKMQTGGNDGEGDYILGGPGDDVLIGGPGCDTIDGQEGNDLIYGDGITENPYYYYLFNLVPAPSLQVVEIAVITYPGYAPESGWLFNSLEDKWPVTVPDNSEDTLVIRYTRYTKEADGKYLTIGNRPDSSAPWWAALRLKLKEYGCGDNDYLAGGPGNDVILGEGGDDTIQGDGTVKGSLVQARIKDGQISELYPSAGAVTDGNDYIEGGSGNDTIFGNLGNDDIVGGSSDPLYLESDDLGSDGEDIIFGGSGTDLESTGSNGEDDDCIIGGNGNIYRVLLGAQGTILFLDPKDGAAAHRAIEPLDYAPFRDDYISPEVYRPVPGDVIHGEQGNDFIYGMEQDDFLYGEGGDDHILGGSGYDKIFGGSGQNRIVQDDF